MADDSNPDVEYDELVTETIDDIKQRVENDDLDLERLLNAEKDNKNRKTLVNWLEEQIDTADTAEDEGNEASAADDNDAVREPTSLEQDLAPATRSLWEQKPVLIGGGLVLGVLVTMLLFVAGVVTPAAGQMTPAMAGDKIDSYLDENRQALRLPPGANLSVKEVSRYESSNFYEASLALTANVQNQTVTQNISAFMTEDGKYLFFGAQPLDMSKSISEQMQQAQQ